MSYILKALKKSEAERAKGSIPRLTPQMAPVPKARRAIWPWVVGTALVVNATVVGFAAWGPEIPLLPGAGRQDGETPIAESSAPVADAALAAAVPEAPANGREPAPAPTAEQGPAPETVGRQPEVPAAQPQAPRARPVVPSQTQSPLADAQRQAAQPGRVEQSQAPRRQVFQQPQNAQQPADEQPQAPQPRSAAQQQAPPRPAAVQQPARPVASNGQATRTQTALAGTAAADEAGETPASPPANSSPPSVGPDATAERAASGAAAPKPARKPREALSRSARPLALGDPLPLGGGSRAPAARHSDLALATPELAPPKVEAEPEPDPYAEVPMLWQLPSVIRSTLPKLNISVHVYSPEVAGRFVIVERTKYREGDVMAGGATLEAILADGVVLDYQGRRYRIGN